MVFMFQKSFIGEFFNRAWKYGFKGEGFKNIDFWTFLGFFGV